MSNYHDPVRHLEYLRQSLSQDKKPIGFFISAGCPVSVPMSPGEPALIPSVNQLTSWIKSELRGNADFTRLIPELEKAKRNVENIEDILSFLRGLMLVSIGADVRGFNETSLVDLEKEICKKIVEKINVKLQNQNTPYHKLVKWISSIDRDVPIEIFTTNYDMLAEQALEDLEVPYFDGFVGANRSFFDLRAIENNLIPKHWTRLWKIHGSINWYQEEVLGLKKVYRSSEIKDDASHLIYPSHLKYEQSRKMPYLALIDQLSRFIRQKSSLLIISGYSFNDDHLNDTIINALKSNPSAMVLALMYDRFYYKDAGDINQERYPKAYKLAENRHNLNIWTFNTAIIGTNKGDWKKTKVTEEKEILNFIEEIPVVDSHGVNETLTKMGDFNVFTNFLKELIGSEKEVIKETKDDK